MFSAHIVFGDIDNHSQMPFPERVEKLKIFWEICEAHKPININPHSFYETDNDSFMAGFSSCAQLIWGEDVIDFTMSLQKELKRNGIDVSFGMNLVACNSGLKWKTYKGFIDDIKMIHMPDEYYEKIGVIQRERLTGDSLIIAARMQNLAKLIKSKICISTFQGGNIGNKHKYHLKDISEQMKKLKSEHYEWLMQRNVKAFIV